MAISFSSTNHRLSAGISQGQNRPCNDRLLALKVRAAARNAVYNRSAGETQTFRENMCNALKHLSVSIHDINKEDLYELSNQIVESYKKHMEVISVIYCFSEEEKALCLDFQKELKIRVDQLNMDPDSEGRKWPLLIQEMEYVFRNLGVLTVKVKGFKLEECLKSVRETIELLKLSKQI
ncbi:hypothetical protein DID78_06965 [Candidatus Marinamargulisbacteria bacterium SCGC AG-343-D04]|nr:hypothetical protein DID78_06965 [Candidatus Marinamargulisbacteria bacterium SCGC AG-343-D04]